jgi:Tfp pilus assembly protein PilX
MLRRSAIVLRRGLRPHSIRRPSVKRSKLRLAFLFLAALVAYCVLTVLLRVYWGVDLARFWLRLAPGAGVVDIFLFVFGGGGGLAVLLRHVRRPRLGVASPNNVTGSPSLITVVRERIGADDGVALVMALMVMVVLLIMATTVIEYTAMDVRSTSNSRQQVQAYSAAEEGMNDALSWFYNNPSQWHSNTPITRGPTSAGPGGLSYTYTLTPNFPVWTISSTGTAPNRTQGTRPDTRVVSRQVKVGEMSNGVSINIWNLYFSDVAASTPSNCMHWNAIIEVPFYVRGDLCLDSNADSDPIPGWPPVTLPGAAQLQVGGHIYLTPPGHLGYGSNHLNIVQTGVGCALYNNGTPGATHNPCNSNDNILANQYLTGTQSMTKPTVDLATWYQDALPGPLHNCTSGTFPGGFDNDGTQNASLGTVNLTPASAYDCQFTDSTGALLGRVKWTPGSPGTLVVAGTLFWDGNLVVSSSFNYQGRATFYFGGTITLNSSVSVCGQPACASSWNTDTNMLVLVAGSAAQSPSWSINEASSSKMQGAMEAVGDINQNNGATMWGGLIAHQFYNLSAHDNWVPFNTGTAGQPSQGTYQEGLSTVPGSYSG